ncbi:CDP-diacylglycerol--serine O-phosphatidyltransferase [hydrothermal vent metagenome]|uniref:CDP-diacylglycerol--serine O-phosphatidyltransferase n=1 Tax=hydrothermal vent metagenome TaxID=652676 RepID=A0A3B0YGE2_9ZZZZ
MMKPVQQDKPQLVDQNTDDLPSKQKKRRRGVYLIPNLFTTFGLFAGFYAIIQASTSNYEYAAIAIIVAMVLDGLDGRIARMTNTQSDFGAEYDSLADMVSFGIAPALIMFEWSLSSMSQLSPEMAKVGWLAAFFYAAMAALRLARFNVQTDTVEKGFFRGLPSPAAAGLVISFIWVCETLDVPLTGKDMLVYSLVVMVVAGALMISPILFNSFKDSNREGKIPFRGATAIVLILILVYLDPPKVLFAVFFIYAISGPVMSLFRRKNRTRIKAQDSAD